ncbi:hypothetical protein [Phocaeicola sp. HCN-6420]
MLPAQRRTNLQDGKSIFATDMKRSQWETV